MALNTSFQAKMILAVVLVFLGFVTRTSGRFGQANDFWSKSCLNIFVPTRNVLHVWITFQIHFTLLFQTEQKRQGAWAIYWIISIPTLILFSGQQMLSPNVALHRTATQVSTFTGHAQGPDYAQQAVDGGFETDIHSGAACAHTNSHYGAWWQVDLHMYYTIEKVAITTRKYWSVSCFTSTKETGFKAVDILH